MQDDTDPGLSITPTYQVRPGMATAINTGRPVVGILREQGVNGHVEMAAGV